MVVLLSFPCCYIELTEHEKKTAGFPRTHSRDSGVYDEEDEDVSVVDAGFDEIMDDVTADLVSKSVYKVFYLFFPLQTSFIKLWQDKFSRLINIFLCTFNK